MDSITIDGLELPVVTPATVAELCGLVTAQRAKKEAVYPVGGRTMLDFGLPPVKPGVAVDMTAMDAVIDYPARDMTITVQAGITFAKLQATLAQENQWLPLDVPDPERMTIGGLIAANVSGPRRYGYGTLRDYVIGISFVSDDGKAIKGGGRVVKNVAGYDLMKLHIGALGTMGIITQVTLKVRPRPETTGGIVLWGEMDEMLKVLELLYDSRSSPMAVWFNNQIASLQAFVVFDGRNEVLQSQIATLLEELTPTNRDISYVMNSDRVKEAIHSTVTRQIASAPYLVQTTLKPTQIPNYIRIHKDIEFLCNVMNGIAWRAEYEPVDESQTYPTIYLRAPKKFKTPERVFGKPTPAWELMAHIKRTLDPDDVFNPGRMFTFPR